MSTNLTRKNQRKKKVAVDAESNSSKSSAILARAMSHCDRAEGSSRQIEISPYLRDESVPEGFPDFWTPDEHLREETEENKRGPSRAKADKEPKRGPEYYVADNIAGIFPSWSTPESIAALRSQCRILDGVKIRLPEFHERSWHCSQGYVCLYESYFLKGRLWFPLPQLLVAYCHERKIAISQLWCMAIIHLLGLLLFGNELKITIDMRFLEEISLIKTINKREHVFYLGYKPVHRLSMHGKWRMSYYPFERQLSESEISFVILEGDENNQLWINRNIILCVCVSFSPL
ncbi:Meiosis-specific protein ASY2 [Cardamine amara subsp. amara]|uniref:Meiosis-specific protein ASY2 n=1 Tax=Cardamine amara subsp. amara TaxID=228776 RepID=A0ABD1BS10_CARAN